MRSGLQHLPSGHRYHIHLISPDFIICHLCGIFRQFPTYVFSKLLQSTKGATGLCLCLNSSQANIAGTGTVSTISSGAVVPGLARWERVLSGSMSKNSCRSTMWYHHESSYLEWRLDMIGCCSGLKDVLDSHWLIHVDGFWADVDMM